MKKRNRVIAVLLGVLFITQSLGMLPLKFERGFALGTGANEPEQAASETGSTVKKQQGKRLLIKIKEMKEMESVRVSVKNRLNLSKFELKKSFPSLKINVMELDEKDDINIALSELKKNPNVLYAQPDYELKPGSIPAEPRFNEQWGLYNNGQTICNQTGQPGADINVIPAWDITKSDPSVTVGLLDGGLDISHPEICGNIFVNTGEIAGNGIDDDQNGYVDDVSGVDFANNDCSVTDSVYTEIHATHIAGTIVAGENDAGTIGVAPQVKILPLKFIEGNTGYTSDAICGIEYAESMHVKIINCSWYGPDYSLALFDAMQQSSMLFVCASGNEGADTTQSPVYPACFNLPNVISVCAVDNQGKLAPFSNYGSNINVSAPGVNILSTLPGNSYGTMSGSSMSTAFVSGTAALLKSAEPGITAQEMAARIKSTVTTSPLLAGKVQSGGIVNAYNALMNIPSIQTTETPTQTPVETPTETPLLTGEPTPSPSPSPTPSLSQSQGLTIKIGSVEGNPGDVVSVPVEFLNIPQNGILCGTLKLLYDKTALTFNRLDGGTIVNEPATDISKNAGVQVPDGMIILYSDYSGGQAPIISPGTFATLNFTINQTAAPGKYEISADPLQLWYDMQHSIIEVTYITGMEGDTIIHPAGVVTLAPTPTVTPLRIGGAETNLINALINGYKASRPWIEVTQPPVPQPTPTTDFDSTILKNLSQIYPDIDVGIVSKDFDRKDYPGLVSIGIATNSNNQYINVVTKREARDKTLQWLLYCLSDEGQNIIASTLQTTTPSNFNKIVNGDLSVEVDNSLLSLCTLDTYDRAFLPSCIQVTPVPAEQALNDVQNESDQLKAQQVIAVVKCIPSTTPVVTPAATPTSSSGLQWYEIAKNGETEGIYMVTKKPARGVADLLIRFFRNPRGQKKAVDNGFGREWVFGDVENSGSCTVVDYTYMRQYLLQMPCNFNSPYWLYSADVSGDGILSAADYNYMRQYLLTIISKFPAESEYSSFYSQPTTIYTARVNVNCIKDKNIIFAASLSNIQDLTSSATFTLTYNSSQLDVDDLCTFTYQKEVTAGVIHGTDVNITSFSPGMIRFNTSKFITPGTSYYGVVNKIRFRPKDTFTEPVGIDLKIERQ